MKRLHRDKGEIYFDILECLKGEEQGANKAQIEKSVRLNSTTATKYLDEMLREGFVVKGQESGYGERYIITDNGFDERNRCELFYSMIKEANVKDL